MSPYPLEGFGETIEDMVRSGLLRTSSEIRSSFAVLALLAMFTTFALPVFGPNLAAYAPNHGHVTLDGYVPPNHVHPWDEQDGVEPNGGAQHAGIEFTLSTDGDAASGWASVTIVPEPVHVDLPSSVAAGVGEFADAPEGVALGAPSPPPRV